MSDLTEIVFKKYSPSELELSKKLNELKDNCPILSSYQNIEFERTKIGMNINFFVYIDKKPTYQLKVLVRKDYPAIDKNRSTYELLQNANINYNELVLASNEIFPYGYYIYKYILGEVVSDNQDWLLDFIDLLKQVHKIQLPFYGSLSNGYQAQDVYQYYSNLDKVIDSSFGNTFIKPFSIWDLVKLDFISQNFLTTTLSYVENQANTLPNLKPHLCHGDMSKNNLLYSTKGIYLIDWDESKSHIWPSELARLLYYTEKEEKELVFKKFIKHYQGDLSTEIVRKIIKLEHIYQHLRNIIIISISNMEIDALIKIKLRVRQIEELLQKA